ncbi:MAG TPA: hypothetical protein VIH90_08415 [Candidatus Saccharimonadales bacterium]
MEDLEQRAPTELHLNREEIAGDIIMGVGAGVDMLAVMSAFVLNYSMDPTIGKVIAGGTLAFVVGGLTNIHGSRRHRHAIEEAVPGYSSSVVF